MFLHRGFRERTLLEPESDYFTHTHTHRAQAEILETQKDGGFLSSRPQT